jgi:maltodextrin utilization protein YvdJ
MRNDETYTFNELMPNFYSISRRTHINQMSSFNVINNIRQTLKQERIESNLGVQNQNLKKKKKKKYETRFNLKWPWRIHNHHHKRLSANPHRRSNLEAEPEPEIESEISPTKLQVYTHTYTPLFLYIPPFSLPLLLLFHSSQFSSFYLMKRKLCALCYEKRAVLVCEAENAETRRTFQSGGVSYRIIYKDKEHATSDAPTWLRNTWSHQDRKVGLFFFFIYVTSLLKFLEEGRLRSFLVFEV